MKFEQSAKKSLVALATVAALGIAPVANAALTSYSQDFEAMNPAAGPGPADLAGDGWLVGANVFDPTGTTFLYNYFAFPAPQGTGAFSDVATGEGGAPQGANQLVAYSDYANGDHAVGNRIESNLFRDIGTVTAGDVGDTWTFSFDAKQGNIGGATTATAFIKALDAGFGLVAQDVLDTTALGTSWTGGSVSLLITNAMVGGLLQIGFTNTASNYDGSGNFYDNINVSNGAAVVPVPAAAWLFGSGLVGLAGVARRRKG